ncbi:MAG: AraC family transcriptional regulator [Tissierellales bacterium]|jgi:AraC-like DNA-binding protein|nr:AraC family transcriptional regulator [Tissierellales bacterium]
MRIKIESRKEYIDFYKSISKINSSNSCEIEMKILPKYGKGYIRLISISDYISIMKIDVIMNETLEIEYRLPNKHFEVSCCLDGTAEIMGDEDNKIFIKKDSVVLLSPKDGKEYTQGVMKFKSSEKFTNIAFSFDKDVYSEYYKGIGDNLWGKVISEKLDRYKANIFAKNIPHIKSLFLKIYDNNLEEEAIRQLFIEGKIIEIITQVAYINFYAKNDMKLNDFEANQIQKIPEMMMKNPMNPPTIRGIAMAINISETKLKKGFKTIYGDTIYSYFKKMKLQRAAHLLETTDQSILKIAETVGYSSQSQFGVAFKKYYGVSPFEYSTQKYIV